MNVILFRQAELRAESRVRLDDRRARHINRVLAAQPGDWLRVGQIGLSLGRGRVLKVAPDSVELEVELGCPPPQALPLTLILALPRPKVLRRVLAAAVTMGVKKIYLINSYRVEKSYWQSPWLSANKLDSIITEALEQAGDCLWPEIHQHRLFRPFVEDQGPVLVAAADKALVLHPYAEKSFSPAAQASQRLLAVGPEGGFIPFEIDLFRRSGFSPVNFGDRILKVEQMIPALLGRLLN